MGPGYQNVLSDFTGRNLGSRIGNLDFSRCNFRNRHLKRNPFTFNTFGPDVASVLFDNTVANAEAQARAMSDVFRGEEGFEDIV